MKKAKAAKPYLKVQPGTAMPKQRARLVDSGIVEAYTIPAPPPGVLPKGKTIKMAMDDAGAGQAINWAAAAYLTGGFTGGTRFLGYPLLAELSQRSEYRTLSEVIATEMTRKWGELKSTGDDDKTDKLKAIKAEMERLTIKDIFKDIALKDGFFGRAHIYIDLGDIEVEPAAVVADRIRNGLKHVPAERLVVAPDCGMKYMPRHVAFGKLKAMGEAAATVRKEIS